MLSCYLSETIMQPELDSYPAKYPNHCVMELRGLRVFMTFYPKSVFLYPIPTSLGFSRRPLEISVLGEREGSMLVFWGQTKILLDTLNWERCMISPCYISTIICSPIYLQLVLARFPQDFVFYTQVRPQMLSKKPHLCFPELRFPESICSGHSPLDLSVSLFGHPFGPESLWTVSGWFPTHHHT